MRHSIKHNPIALWLILFSAIAAFCPWQVSSASGIPQQITVHFDPGQFGLSEAERNKIHHVFQKLNPKGNWKVLVEGHTDDKGDDKKNKALSLKRAEAVKRLLTKEYGLHPDRIFTRGMGEATPVASNRNPKGRTRNRRVEISMLGPVAWPEKVRDAVVAPKRPEIRRLVQEAQTLAKKGDWELALSRLSAAKKLGGDRVSSWNAAYGIIGYHRGVPDRQVKSYLVKAVTLDPFNSEAREYLGRIEARALVAEGKISADQGRSADDPIRVTAVSQEYELMRLFSVIPVSTLDSPQPHLEVWECKTPDNETVIYYFDRSNLYQWAFR